MHLKVQFSPKNPGSVQRAAVVVVDDVVDDVVDEVVDDVVCGVADVVSVSSAVVLVDC